MEKESFIYQIIITLRLNGKMAKKMGLERKEKMEKRVIYNILMMRKKNEL